MAKEEEEKIGQAARGVERREHVGTGKHRPPQHLLGTCVWLKRPGPHSPWKENEQGLLVPQRRTQMRFLLPLKDIGWASVSSLPCLQAPTHSHHPLSTAPPPPTSEAMDFSDCISIDLNLSHFLSHQQ